MKILKRYEMKSITTQQVQGSPCQRDL